MTFEGLAQKFVKSIPSASIRVDIVADTYRETSIESIEGKNRGESSKVLIKSLKSKVPRDFPNFLLNGDNKTTMMELIAEYIVTSKVFNILRYHRIAIALDNKCTSVTKVTETEEETLLSNQEEADTKLKLHTLRGFIFAKINFRVDKFSRLAFSNISRGLIFANAIITKKIYF